LLHNKALIKESPEIPEATREEAEKIEEVVRTLVGLTMLLDDHVFYVGESPSGYAIHNDRFRLSFDIVMAAQILSRPPEKLDDRQRVLYEIISQSAIIREAFRIPEEGRFHVVFKFGERELEMPLDEIGDFLTKEAEEELDKAIERGEVPAPIDEERETDAEGRVKTRLGQSLVRKRILGVYGNRCALCNMTLRDMLIAAHIIPWGHERKTRLNLRNMMCLCALHDKAFEQGYITVGFDKKTVKYYIEISQEFDDFLEGAEQYQALFPQALELAVPAEYSPDPEFLEYHRQVKFRG